MKNIAIVALTPNGLELGRRLAEPLSGEVISGQTNAKETLQQLFGAGRPLICIMALGIVVRILGPLAQNKETDPAVVAIDEAGQFVISVLGGHVGGANALAKQAAKVIGAVPVITTASEALGLPPLDLIGRDWGWKIERPENVKRVAAAAVRGETIGVYQDIGRRDWWQVFGEWPANFQPIKFWPPQGTWAGLLIITDLQLPGQDLYPSIIYRPPTLVLGVGCRRGVPAEQIETMFQDVCRDQGFAPLSLGTVATAALKADEPGLVEFAARHGVPLRTFALEELAAVPDLPSPSENVHRKLGVWGVAEPAAILAADTGRLVMLKRRGERITMALARRGRMTVYFIGAGPGDPELVTIRGRKLIERCPICLYAGSLVPAEIVACAPPNARVIDTASLHLDQIIGHMREAHAAGLDVARVHSGDPTIYGAIAEQMRRLDEEKIPYEVVPGVSSFTAAAAALGLELTPAGANQTVILTRAPGRTGLPPNESLAELARHRVGLVLFLSAAQAAAVVEALTPHYGPEAPVVIAYRVSWPDQLILRCTLATLEEEMRAAKIHLTALILVGPMLEADRACNSHLYDPGYTHRFRRGEKHQP